MPLDANDMARRSQMARAVHCLEQVEGLGPNEVVLILRSLQLIFAKTNPDSDALQQVCEPLEVAANTIEGNRRGSE